MIRLLLMAAVAAPFLDVAPRSGRFSPLSARLIATHEKHGGPVLSIDVSRDGSRMITCSATNTFLSDTRTWKKIREFDHYYGSLVKFMPDGKRAIGVGRDRTSLRVVDTERGLEMASISNVWAFTTPFALSLDGTTVAACQTDRSVRTFSVVTGEEKSQLIAPSQRPTGSLTMSPDGKLVGMIGWDGSVRVIGLEKFEEVTALEVNQDRAGTLIFTPDSKSFLVTGVDRRVRLFDVATGKSTIEFPETPMHARTLAFAPGGTCIAAGDQAGNLLFWEAATGKEIARIAAQQGAIHSLIFTPDGRNLISGGGDGTIKIWGATGVARRVSDKPRAGKPAYLGVRPVPPEADVKGVVIGEVMAGTAAEKAGLAVGDVITHIGETAVNNFEEMKGILGGMFEGDEIDIVYRRGGAERKAAAKLGVRPESK